MDEFLILLQAKLDEAKSKGNINADINKIQDQIDKLKIQATIDPKTISNLVKQLETVLNQKINISNIGVDTNSAVKSAQQAGKQISYAFNKEMQSATSATNKVLRDFSELNTIKRQFVDGHDLISKEDISDAEKFYDTVRKAFSEFGQVTVSKGEMTDGVLDSMRVKIEQVNDEAKITRDFMLYLNQADNFGNSFKLADDDTIKSTEKMIQHLNEKKNIVNATGEEANAIKEKLAEQEKYYDKLRQASKEQLTIENRRITAGEKQLEILDAQSKRRDSRISYNEGQIDKKGLSDTAKQREINDLVYAGSEKLDASFAKEIDKNLSNLSKLKSKWQEQGIYVDEFKEKVTGLESALNNIDSGDIKGLNGIRQQIESLKTDASQIAEANKIQLSIDNGTYDATYDNLVAKTQQWSFQNDKLTASVKELETAYEGFDNVNTDEEKIAAAKRWEQAVKSVNNAVKQTKLEYATDDKIAKFHQQVQETYDKNSAMHKDWGKELQQMLTATSSGAKVLNKDFDTMYARLLDMKNEARQAGKLGKSFFDTIKSNVQSYLPWVSMAGIVGEATQKGKQIIENVKELDDALTNISYTMDVTETQLKDIGNTSLQTAKGLHTSASNVLDAVKTYANATETAESILNKAKPTIMMSNVTGMGTEQTVDIIQGTIEQFDLEDTEEQLMHISDVLQTVSMSMPYDFAKGVKELSEGIQASGSVAKDAGYDLENYTSLLGTLISKTRQSGSELGRSLRTMFVRTTKASSSALANGEVTEDDLSNAEKALRRVGIEVRSDVDTFKSFDEIMSELYEKVDSLSDVDLSNIAYEVASTRQTNVFKMMIKAYGDYQEMAEKAYNADGATLSNQEKYAESLTGKLTEIFTIWDKIGDEAVSSNSLKWLADMGIGASELVEKFGLLKTLIYSIGTYAGATGHGLTNYMLQSHSLRVPSYKVI